MRVVAFALTSYILLILFQPAYLHVANLFCSDCSASGGCLKQHTSQCSDLRCHGQKQLQQQRVNSPSPHVSTTCPACNPFLVCSGSGFVFSATLFQQSISPAEDQIILPADESISYPFVHELLHPPQYS